MLALATNATSAVDALSDYKGLERFEEAPQDVISRRQSIYSGVKVQLRARAPKGFRVVKVAAHVAQEDCTSAEERYRALGNEFADRLAKEAALKTQSPTNAQLQQYHLQVGF
jgi:predicted secreted protein